MAGIFGEISEQDCMRDLYWGGHFLQHRAQDFCGISSFDGQELVNRTHGGLVREAFDKKRLGELKGKLGISSVSTDRQPMGEHGKQDMIVTFDGNIVNSQELIDEFIKKGSTFSEFGGAPGKITDNNLVTKIITSEPSFVSGIERLAESIKGDFAVVGLTEKEVYAARGWGRKPLILGQKEGTYAVSSESCAFENLDIAIFRDVTPGEVVLLNREGIHTLKQLELSPIKFGTFEYIYTAFPASIIDGRCVGAARIEIGKLLAKRYPIDADLVFPFPESGRFVATGYALESGIPLIEVFPKYSYAGRSFTPQEQEDRDEEALHKLIAIRELIQGRRLIGGDDSVVRGTQMLNRCGILREYGAKEIHLIISCMPLMAACDYGKTIKQDEECIARRMTIPEIEQRLRVDSLGYAHLEDVEKAIGHPREQLCLECWAI